MRRTIMVVRDSKGRFRKPGHASGKKMTIHRDAKGKITSVTGGGLRVGRNGGGLGLGRKRKSRRGRGLFGGLGNLLDFAI